MAARIKQGSRRGLGPIFRIKVVLEGTEPAVWRRLSVPGAASLAWVHAVLQVAMGWTNSHLHRFEIQGVSYSETGLLEGDLDMVEESQVRLAEVQAGRGEFLYEYDFGDSWFHRVQVEEVLKNEAPAVQKALCLGGERACPPEDCGGVWGYANLLEALKDRKHPEHREMKTWVGRSWKPEVFEVDKVNTWLRQLKWPRASESHLRSVLMGRDGYRVKG